MAGLNCNVAGPEWSKKVQQHAWGEGAAIILYENDAEGVEAVIWRECDVEGGRDRDSRETWEERLVVRSKAGR